MSKPKTKVINFHCPVDLHADLMALARHKGEAASTLLRQAARDLVRAGGDVGKAEGEA